MTISKNYGNLLQKACRENTSKSAAVMYCFRKRERSAVSAFTNKALSRKCATSATDLTALSERCCSVPIYDPSRLFR